MSMSTQRQMIQSRDTVSVTSDGRVALAMDAVTLAALSPHAAFALSEELRKAATRAVELSAPLKTIPEWTLCRGDRVLSKYFGWGEVTRFNYNRYVQDLPQQYRHFPLHAPRTEFFIRTDRGTSHWCAFEEVLDHKPGVEHNKILRQFADVA